MERADTLKAELSALDKRLAELEKLIQAAYEDKVMGRIPEGVCIQLLNKYEAERTEKLERKKDISAKLAASRANEQSVDDWLDMMQDYAQLEELAKAEKRKAEVDRLFDKMYEDWFAECITGYNFNMLSQKYQAEQSELIDKIDRIKAELTAELLNTLIEKIVIHEATKDADGMREQEIEIYYRFVGKID